MPATIKFYYPNDLYGEFSNFYARPITIADVQTGEVKVWEQTEQFFQAMKSVDPIVQEYVRTTLKRPDQAKTYCSQQVQLRPDWEHAVLGFTEEALKNLSDDQGLVVERVKDHFMYQALTAKFTQHTDLGQVLLGTGDALLVEDTQKVGSDPYWGNGPSGNGLNKLGRMLVLVRKFLPQHLHG